MSAPVGIRVGDTLSCVGTSKYSRAIQLVLRTNNPDYDGESHDAQVGELADGTLCVQHCAPWRAKVVTFEQWQAWIDQGVYSRVVVARPLGATPEQGKHAARWWMENVYKHWYDFWGVANVMLKALGRKIGLDLDGWRWAWFCTEGNRGGWLDAGNDPWGEDLPHPGTTAKRIASGRMIRIGEWYRTQNKGVQP